MTLGPFVTAERRRRAARGGSGNSGVPTSGDNGRNVGSPAFLLPAVHWSDTLVRIRGCRNSQASVMETAGPL